MNTIDLSRLPTPTIIEPLSYEEILSELKADLLDRDPDLADVLGLESEPLVKLLEVTAYRELIIRQRHNERVRQLLLAYATEDALDHIGVSYLFTERLELTPADPTANPPVAATYESDEDYRRRLLLAPDRFSTAGAEAAYQYHALSAAGDVKDVSASSPAATEVVVAVLAREGNGTASPALVAQVEQALTAELVRPLTDLVTVTSAHIISYQVEATFTVRPGPSPDVVQTAARQAVQAFVEHRHRLGEDIVRDALLAALYVEGVERVTLTQPQADIICTPTQAAYCVAIEIATDD